MSDLMKAQQLNAIFLKWLEHVPLDCSIEEALEECWGMFADGMFEIVYDENGVMSFDDAGYTRNERRVVRELNRPIVEAWKG